MTSSSAFGIRWLTAGSAAVLSLSMLVAGSPAYTQASVNTASSVTDTDDDGVLDALDTAGAARAAAESNRSVEDLSRRTETDQVFANPDGTWSVESYADPKRVQNDDGS